MIAKVAESLALRKAFPQELAGLYSSDEMSDDIINIVPEASEVLYEATNEQKKILVDIIHKFGIEKHDKIVEDYKWFNDRILGSKMTDLYNNVGLVLHEFKTHTEEKKVCQE